MMDKDGNDGVLGAVGKLMRDCVLQTGWVVMAELARTGWSFSVPRPFVRPGHPHPDPHPLLTGFLGERGNRPLPFNIAYLVSV